MIYLTDIEFKENVRCLNKGLHIDFKDVTLLVGNQGCGKSSLLELLSQNSKKIKFTITDDTRKNGIGTFYFDSEKMNPRVRNFNEYTNPDGTTKGIGIGGAISSKFKSHGEVLVHFTVSQLNIAKNAVIFLDEPESSLSLCNQIELIKAIKKASKTCQLVIATHCYPLIYSFDEVYDLENKKWVNSSQYLKQFSL